MPPTWVLHITYWRESSGCASFAYFEQALMQIYLKIKWIFREVCSRVACAFKQHEVASIVATLLDRIQ